MGSDFEDDDRDDDYVLGEKNDDKIDKVRNLDSCSQKISDSDSDYEMGEDDNAYANNVDQNLEWLEFENQVQEQMERDAKKKKIAKNKWNIGNGSENRVDNSDKMCHKILILLIFKIAIFLISNIVI